MPDSLLPTSRQHLEVSPEFTPRPKVEYKPVSEFDGRRRNNLTPEQRSRVGRAGGLATSSDRLHMAEIGRKGGSTVANDREHMREIGRKGGRSFGPKRKPIIRIGEEPTP